MFTDAELPQPLFPKSSPTEAATSQKLMPISVAAGLENPGVSAEAGYSFSLSQFALGDTTLVAS